MPQVFISYSHDSPEHRETVNALSERLRQDGIETILDRYVEGTPPEGWPRWMMNGLDAASHVLVICTATYYRRFRGHEVPGKGKGVDWEGALITQEIYDSRSNTTKFVPVFLSEADDAHIPDPLRGHTHYALVSEQTYLDLYDFLLGQAGVQPGPVGTPRLRDRPTAAPLTFGPAPAAAAQAVPANLPGGYLDRLFLGREEFLETLRQSLLGGSHATAITQRAAATGISGLGGIGKTHAAIAYADRYRDHYSALLFATADTPEKLRSSLAGLCEVLPLADLGHLPPDEPTRLRAALDWLGAHPGWLLIIDNVDDEPAALALRDMLGQLRAGHVLITSRLHGWSDQVKTLDLEVLAEPAAADLLLRLTASGRRLAADDSEQALQLARLLDGLPLAIHQAAGFINERARTLAQYHEHYLRESETLLAWFNDLALPYERPDKLAPRPVLVTWKSSFEQLTEDERFWLLVFSHFSPEPIPEFLLEPTENATPEQIALLDQASAAIARAEKFCLLSRSRTAPVFKVHRLVQQIVRMQSDASHAEDAVAFAMNLLACAEPGDPFDAQDWQKWNLLLSHGEAICSYANETHSLDHLSWLLGEIGGLHFTKALYSEAAQFFERSLRVCRKEFGDDHPRLAICQNNLGGVYQTNFRFEEAEAMFRDALRIDRGVYGDSHPRVALDLNNLAGLLRSKNCTSEVEALMREALRIDRVAFGNHHPHVASDLNNLGTFLHATKQLEEAEALIREALLIDRATLGDDHPVVARDLNNLAQLLQETDRFDDAEPLMRTALQIDRLNFGDNHPNVARDLSNLAQLLHATLHLTEAEPLMWEALRIDRVVFGDDHPEVARDFNNLALLLQFTNRLDEAEPLMRDALRIFKASVGKEHPKTQIASKNLEDLLKQKANAPGEEDKGPARS